MKLSFLSRNASLGGPVTGRFGEVGQASRRSRIAAGFPHLFVTLRKSGRCNTTPWFTSVRDRRDACPTESLRLGSKLSFRSRERGAVLLEVVLALILFVAAAAVITGGMHASLDSVDRMRLNTHAADLAISVISELQLGIRGLDLTGPEPFEPPYENWTWEIVITSDEVPVVGSGLAIEEESPLTQVEVIIRHQDPPLTYRLSQLIRPGAVSPPTEESELETTY